MWWFNVCKYGQEQCKHLNVVGSVTGPLIEEETFWERCCKARWDLCDVSCYDNCWKRMYFERHLEETLEKFVPPDLTSSMHGDSMKEVGGTILRDVMWL